jgi:ATP-binding cassette subfamily B protein
MWDVLAGLWTAIWAYRWRTAGTLGLLVAAKLAAVAVPLALKAIVDHFSQTRVDSAAATSTSSSVVLALPVFVLLGYAVLRFASTLFTELRDVLFSRVTLHTVSQFVQRTFGHLLTLSPRFHSQRNTGMLIRDIQRGTTGIAFLLGAALFTLLPTLVEFCAVIVILMAAGYSVWFTLVIAITFFFYAGYTTGVTRRRERRQRIVNEIDSRAHGRMVDALINYETVTTYARQGYERQRHADILAQWIEASVASQRTLSALHIGQSAIIAGGVATVMLLAGQYTLEGEMSVGDLVLVNAYLIQICLPLNTLGFVFRQTLDAAVDTERLFALLRRQPEITDRLHSKPLALRGGSVAFEHVDFAYEAGRPILRDFNLRLAAGQTVAVVGGSGSGKSTLARLLLRLYDPEAGRVTVDEQDLRSVTLDSLHDSIGVVAQDTALFNATIAYNIGYGRAGAGMAEIIEAAKAAQVHEFVISLPRQYDTVVGERGLKLSGGEKQRIAIARALLKNPPILVFDEATSALDTRAERAIQGALDRIARGRTALIIAHRLSTIVDADQIVVMDKGRIVESGRHEALLEHDGLYAQLWNLQLQQREFERLERRLARQPVNLAVLLAGTIDAIREPIEERGVSLYTDIDPANASVSGDPGALGKTLHEIARQAVFSTPRGGRVEIRLERHEVDARIAITDGRHFRRGTAAPANDADFTAPPLDPLELRSIIERQGGEFVMMSDIDGGMRYVVDLPLQPIAVPTEPHIAEPRAARPHGPMLAGLTVMCIDDHADALESLELMLHTEGATVVPFQQGGAALAWLEQHPVERWPHLLVCDISLGEEEDGHAIMRHIRQLEAQRGVPLDRRMPAIALTGHARPEDRLRALMAGFQMHLVKPVDAPVLTETLATLAGRAPNEDSTGITKAPSTGESIAPAPWVTNLPREGRK